MIAEPSGTGAGSHGPSNRVHPHSRRSAHLRRTPLDYAFIFMLLTLITLVTVGALWQFWHVNRIYSGVSIAGVPVGGLTRAEATGKLTSLRVTASAPPVRLYLDTEDVQRQWSLPVDQVRLALDVPDAVNQAYLLGREGTARTRMIQQLGLLLRGYDLQPSIELDPVELGYTVSDIAADVRRPGRPAVTTETVTVPGQPGLDVDEAATVDAVLDAVKEHAGRAHIRVPLVVISTTPPDAAAPPVPALVPADAPLPFRLRAADSNAEFAIDPAVMERVVFSRIPLRLDRDVLRAHLAALAAEIDRPPRDARLRFDPATGGLTVIQSSRYGRALDIDATINAIETALVADMQTADLVLQDLAPAVDMNRVAEMGIRELVASGTSYFAGSSAARIRNIEVGAEKFEGVVIPPGEIFSFNRFVEDVSAANGFEDSLIIWGDRTAVGVGGGVCQVSTTIFRAAFQAGLPIVERYNHGYVVSWYGEPGMDATIYTPTVDFRFRNDTGAHLLIDPVVDSAGGTITFNLYGTRPDREVRIGEPVISEVTEPEAALYQVDEELAPGEIEQVEWPKEGMTVTVERTIIEDGRQRVDAITSYYQPWRAIYLMGPGTRPPNDDS